MKTKKWFCRLCRLYDIILPNHHLYTKHGLLEGVLDNRAKEEILEVLFIEAR